jgi:hypothetical protein
MDQAAKATGSSSQKYSYFDLVTTQYLPCALAYSGQMKHRDLQKPEAAGTQELMERPKSLLFR